MKKIIFLILTLSIISSCSKRNYKTIDFGRFAITVPEDWNKYEKNGIDSYIGGLITDSNDTLNFDLGRYSADVSTDFPLVYDEELLKELPPRERELLSKTKHKIVESWTIADGDFERYRKYDVVVDSINCFEAKIITPRNKGFGASGIYIDSLSGNGADGNMIKFKFYGYYLSDKTQKEFLKSLKTLDFKKYCSQQHIL